MSRSDGHDVEHEITISAPAAVIYRLLADVAQWPRIFPPTVYADHIERSEGSERIRIWATANGELKSWTSARVLNSHDLRIDFRQEVSQPPVAAMSGTWVIEKLSEVDSRVRLQHSYRAVDNDPSSLAWIDEAVDRNSRSELEALKANVEFANDAEGLTFSFEDTVHIHGSPEDVYSFINDADLWPERLPHVLRVRLTEEVPGLQTLEMDTRAADSSVHTTESYRVTFPYHKIAYKQTKLPALLRLHTGCWTIQENAEGVAVSSQHTVVINIANIEPILGKQATVDDAKGYVKNALSTNSLTTLNHAKLHIEKPE